MLNREGSDVELATDRSAKRETIREGKTSLLARHTDTRQNAAGMEAAPRSGAGRCAVARSIAYSPIAAQKKIYGLRLPRVYR